MVPSLVQVSRRPRFVPAETAAALCAALCWRLLAFGVYAEGYDRDPSAPRRMSGDAEIAHLALLTGVRVPLLGWEM
ncbi:hypothetical protein AB0929_08665 [Streptomyces massasporeus]|uniref:hypothetical protein n=1 Tax=Streptomyces massasporeus TaxID=67324 RepID=UPI0034530AB1